MGKVGVILSKAEGGGGMSPTLSSGGQVGLMMNTSPEKVNYAQYGAGVDDKGNPYGGSAGQEKWARNFGSIGSKARVGLGALSGLNSLYNATSSGQPGALSAFGQGAMGGYYGSQGLEGWAADKGSQFGAWRNQRNAPPKPDMNAIGRDRARQEGMADYTQGVRDDANPDAAFDSSMFDPVEQQQRAMNNLSRQHQNTGGLYGGNTISTNTPKDGHGPRDGSNTPIAQGFMDAAKQPNLNPQATQQTGLEGGHGSIYAKHGELINTLKDRENESKDGASSSTIQG